MSHVSLSEISTRRLPLHDEDQNKGQPQGDHELQFMGEDNQDFVIQDVFSADLMSHDQ